MTDGDWKVGGRGHCRKPALLMLLTFPVWLVVLGALALFARAPHPVDPTRRRRIEDPDEYERGRRDGQDEADEQATGGKFAVFLVASGSTLIALAGLAGGVLYAVVTS